MAKKIAFCGIFTALALVLSYFERLIPVPIPVPGIKLGLANVIVLIILYYIGTKEAMLVSFIRIVLAGLMFAGLSGMLYSLSGGLLSFLMMFISKKVNIFSIIGVSVVGAAFHNIGQIIIACLVISNFKLLYYVPMLIILGMIMGIVTGIIALYSLRHLAKAF